MQQHGLLTWILSRPDSTCCAACPTVGALCWYFGCTLTWHGLLRLTWKALRGGRTPGHASGAACPASPPPACSHAAACARSGPCRCPQHGAALCATVHPAPGGPLLAPAGRPRSCGTCPTAAKPVSPATRLWHKSSAVHLFIHHAHQMVHWW